MLKLLNTLLTVLKYLPVEKAQDARSFMLSFQYWLGGTPDNLKFPPDAGGQICLPG